MKIVWAGIGAAVAVVVLYQVGRARSAADSVAKTLTPEGLVEALTQGVDELRLVGRELRGAMREQEARLTADLLPAPEVVDDARTLRAAARSAPSGAAHGSRRAPNNGAALTPRSAPDNGAANPWDDAEF